GAVRSRSGDLPGLDSSSSHAGREFYRREGRSIHDVVAEGQGRARQLLGDFVLGLRRRNAEDGADLRKIPRAGPGNSSRGDVLRSAGPGIRLCAAEQTAVPRDTGYIRQSDAGFRWHTRYSDDLPRRQGRQDRAETGGRARFRQTWLADRART